MCPLVDFWQTHTRRAEGQTERKKEVEKCANKSRSNFYLSAESNKRTLNGTKFGRERKRGNSWTKILKDINFTRKQIVIGIKYRIFPNFLWWRSQARRYNFTWLQASPIHNFWTCKSRKQFRFQKNTVSETHIELRRITF